MLLLLGAGAVAAWSATPSVADAQSRVAARNAADGADYPGAVPSSKVVASLVATEDASFYSNSGVDVRGVARGAWGAVRGATDAGGATLEQQLAKVLYTGGRSGPAQVAEQLVLSVKLAQHWTKSQILQMYLSTVYFGDGAYGLDAASRHYFGVDESRLSWAQASVLAGLVQAPSAYDPLVHLTLAKQRQRDVLDRLVAVHALSAAQADAAYAAPLDLR